MIISGTLWIYATGIVAPCEYVVVLDSDSRFVKLWQPWSGKMSRLSAAYFRQAYRRYDCWDDSDRSLNSQLKRI